MFLWLFNEVWRILIACWPKSEVDLRHPHLILKCSEGGDEGRRWASAFTVQNVFKKDTKLCIRYNLVIKTCLDDKRIGGKCIKIQTVSDGYPAWWVYEKQVFLQVFFSFHKIRTIFYYPPCLYIHHRETLIKSRPPRE